MSSFVVIAVFYALLFGVGRPARPGRPSEGVQLSRPSRPSVSPDGIKPIRPSRPEVP